MLDQPSNSLKIEHQLRRAGFQILLAFSVVIAFVIILSAPANIYIAIFITSFWFLLSVYALNNKHHSVLCAKVWTLISLPIIPVLIYYNGIVPATLISFATIVPVILHTGLWRLISVVFVASCTLLVPFSDVSFDEAIWLRLSVMNFTVAALIYSLVTILEKALIGSLNKSDALDKALEGERQAYRSQSVFLASMSHEIRTPMNGIFGLVDIVLASDLTEQQRTHLLNVKRSGHILRTILNDILDFSKLTAGKLVIESRSISIQHIVQDTESLFATSLAEKDVSLHSEVDPRLAQAHLSDPIRLTQILSNLISNAIKFTHSGTVTISVNVTASTESNQQLIFCVADTGIGISAEKIKTIFEPFTQAHSGITRDFGGTGLGLQISKNLVEKMGGNIGVESVEGKGSQFYFTLDLAISNEPPVNLDNKEDSQQSQFTGLALVVDDNEINQIVAREILIQFGLKVMVASTGAEAIEAAENIAFDIIFMDLHMPKMDGIEAAARIRKNNSQMPIIALTAAVLEDEVSRALEVGMNSHLAKPIDHDELQAVLKRYLHD